MDFILDNAQYFLGLQPLQICLQKTNFRWSLHDFNVEGPYLMLMRCNQ